MIWKYHFNPKIFNFDFKIFNLKHGHKKETFCKNDVP